MFQRKDGLWCERIVIDGKEKRVTAKTKSALMKKLRDHSMLQEQGPLFSEVADLWLDNIASQIEHKTLESYSPHVARAKEFFEGQHTAEITPAQCQSFLDQLASKRYSRDTVSRAKVILSNIFSFAITLPGSTLRINPAVACKLPRGLSHTRREPPTKEQLIKVNPDTQMGLFACFLVYTGMRRGELLALRWENIDFEDDKINVTSAVSFVGSAPTVKEPKTAAGIRTIPLLPQLKAVLPRNKKGYVFGGDKPLSAHQFTRGWTEWCASVGLAEKHEESHVASNKHRYTKVTWKPLVTPHQFRHLYASLLFKAGVTDLDTQAVMGHASITITRSIYQHLADQEHHDEVSERLTTYLAANPIIIQASEIKKTRRINPKNTPLLCTVSVQ